MQNESFQTLILLIIIIQVYNTFQVVLATDASQTVAIFIYDDIQWERRTQIGFNFGDGENSLTISQTVLDQILNISELSNIGKRGVFVFRLDSMLKTCNSMSM